MKLIFCLLLVASQVSFGQIVLKDSSFSKIQLPSYKNNLLQMPGNFFQNSPHDNLLISPVDKSENGFAIQYFENSKLMLPDNMVCLIPDLSKSEKMPNAGLYYLQSNDLMPNSIANKNILSKK